MAQTDCFALFATPLGTCAIAWSEIGVTSVWLPEADAASLRRKVSSRCAEASETARTDAIAAAVAVITRLLAGERRVDAVTREINPGEVLTYGEVAARVGGGASARAAGQSLGRNAMPIVVPCHRVVAAGNGLGGFSALGGASTKRRPAGDRRRTPRRPARALRRAIRRPRRRRAGAPGLGGRDRPGC